MSTTAKDRGWGDPTVPGYSNKLTTVRAGGIVVYVRTEIAALVAHLLDETVRRGYRFDKVADDWSYANRPIRGYEAVFARTHDLQYLSNHAWGLALDLNSSTNPMLSGRVVTDMPDWMVKLWQSWGFRWGGGYSGSRKDPMHYEFMGTPADAADYCRRLASPATRVGKVVRRALPTPRPKTNPYGFTGGLLQQGATGNAVRAVQWALRLDTDGKFGPITKGAVVRFQKAHHLVADGMVGPRTRAALARVTR